MPLVINTNVGAMNAQRQIVRSSNDLSTAMERLSSGRRINSAADDAAGLAISNRMTSQIRGLSQAVRNANDGISLIQTAEGALDETTNILQRIRELAIQAANGIYADKDRATLDAEVQQLMDELDRIADSTTFNGQKLLDGSLGGIDLQVGVTADDTIKLNIPSFNTQELGLGAISSDVSGSRMADLLDLAGENNPAGGLSWSDGDILINGESIGAFDGSSNSIQDILNNINENVTGVTANGFNIVEAATPGSGQIGSDDTLTISVFDIDGDANAQTDFTFKTGAENLNQLVESINAKMGGLLEASLNDTGSLVLSNSSGASFALSYDNNGTSTSTGISSVLGITSTGGIETTDPEQFVTGSDQAFFFSGSLSLTSDTGEDITIEAGINGAPLDLSNLGFQEVSLNGTVTGLGNNVNGTAFNTGLDAGELKINGISIPSSETKSLQGVVDAINKVTNETAVVAASIAQASYKDNTSEAAVELVMTSTIDLDIGTFSLNGVDITTTANTVQNLATAINTESDKTGVTAFIDNNGLLRMFSESPINISDGVSDNLNVADLRLENAYVAAGNGLINPINSAETLFTNLSSKININGTDVTLSDLSDINQLITDINTAEANTGVHASIGINGGIEFSSASNISFQLSDERISMTAAYTLGITDLILDDNQDGNLDSTAVTVEPGIKLTSINGNTISIDASDSATKATGLLSQNTDLSSIASGTSISGISVATQAGAQAALKPIDNALEQINDIRSQMGAINNRLDFTINNLMNVTENTAAARSRIMDADFAAESSELSRSQILQQASQAMLAQANAMKQSVLQLLQG